MTSALTLAEVKTRSLDFVNLLGNEHHTTSAKIIGLLGEEFAVQHGEMPPSTGGRDAFLTTIGGRLKLAQGKASVDVKHVIAETYLDGVKGGQCWVYSRKNTPLGCSNSLDMITFNPEGKIVFCQDLHSPREERVSRLLPWLTGFLSSLLWKQ